MKFLGEIAQKAIKVWTAWNEKKSIEEREKPRYSKASHRWLTFYHDHQFNLFENLWSHKVFPAVSLLSITTLFDPINLSESWLKCVWNVSTSERDFYSTFSFMVLALHKDRFKIMKHCSSGWTFTAIKYFNLNEWKQQQRRVDKKE